MKIKYYKLQLVEREQSGVQTACILGCSLCGIAISGMGGPVYDAICLECGDKISSGEAELRVIPDDE